MFELESRNLTSTQLYSRMYKITRGEVYYMDIYGMADKRGQTPMSKKSGGDEDGDAGASARFNISGRTGAMVMRTVSIFLAKGRKISVASRRQQSITPTAPQRENPPIRRRRKMPDDPRLKSAAYHAKVVETLKKKTKFSKSELESLCKIYSKLTTRPGQRETPTTTCSSTPTLVQTVEGIDRTIFRELLHNTFGIITEDALIERMFLYWDRDSEGAIRLERWILGLDVFLRGGLRDKMEYCFRVYDLNNDGFITKDEIFILFKNCLLKQPGDEDPDEGVRDLSEMVLRKMDLDHDGKISYPDYEATTILHIMTPSAQVSIRDFQEFLARHAVSATKLSELEQPHSPEIGGQSQPLNDFLIPLFDEDDDDEEQVPVEVSNTNKNVNVILNVDPKQIAIELWAMIANHLQSRQTMSDKVEVVNEIEKIVEPLMRPSRRGLGPSTFDVADDLERLTRTLLSNDNPTLDPMDKVILVKDIVSDMLQSLKTSSSLYQRQVMDYNRKLKYQMADPYWGSMYPSSRRSMDSHNSNPKYLVIKVKGKKNDKLI